MDVPDRSSYLPRTRALVVFGRIVNILTMPSAKLLVRSRRSCSSFCILPFYFRVKPYQPRGEVVAPGYVLVVPEAIGRAQFVGS